MSKLFKVGDKVQRVVKVDGKTMRGEIVVKGSGFNIDIKLTEGAGRYVAGDIYCGNIGFWEVIEEADELPPVPESVLYFNSVRDDDNDQRLVVEMASDSDRWSDKANAHVGIMVIPRTGSTRASKGIGINLSPDAALQLAHDIRRMAMDIRRKEKASEV